MNFFNGSKVGVFQILLMYQTNVLRTDNLIS